MKLLPSKFHQSSHHHSAALVCSLPIHFWTESLLFLCSLQYCSDITVLLCYGLNLLFNIEKRHFVILHFSFSSWVNVCRSYRPSWPNQFVITGTSSSSVTSYALVSRMFWPPLKLHKFDIHVLGLPVECWVLPVSVYYAFVFVALYHLPQWPVRVLPLHLSVPSWLLASLFQWYLLILP